MLGEMFDILNKNSVSSDEASKYKARRKKLLTAIEEEYPQKKGKLILFAPVELDNQPFLQDSSFFYFTGISEPAVVLVSDAQEGTTLYVPHFGDVRSKWMHSQDIINEQTISLFGIDSLKMSGAPMTDYQMFPYFSAQDYSEIIVLLQEMMQQKQTVFTLYPSDKRSYVFVRQIVDRLLLFLPELAHYIVDISPLVGELRRKKEISEIEQMYQAIGITQTAFQAAARVLKPGAREAELQAAIEYIFTENGARPAYPSIVAGGKRATILHYHTNNQELEDGEVVLIDAGARYGQYCADITRVLPVSGAFTDRQKELYEIVLETQLHVVEHIRPGVWISNPKEQDVSLQHIAVKFLKKKGYDSYFIHGIGHYLGLDVHDVGSRLTPLKEGDVITVEPGIYMPDESIGIRIEDNYWVVQDAEPVCLSEDIPKAIQDIEDMVQESFDIDVE